MITEAVKIKETIKNKMVEEFGSIGYFAKTKKGKKYKNLYVYLSPNGPISYTTLANLCTDLKIGKLSKEVKVTREITYELITEKNKQK